MPGRRQSHHCPAGGSKKSARQPTEKLFNLVQTYLEQHAVKVKNDDHVLSDFSCLAPDLKERQESIPTFEFCQKETPL
jgi:hypothetical protein